MTNHIASNLKRLRALRGYSADVVATAIDVKRSTYSGWENGAAEPGLSNLLKLGEYFRLSLDILVGRDLLLMAASSIEELQRAY